MVKKKLTIKSLSQLKKQSKPIPEDIENTWIDGTKSNNNIKDNLNETRFTIVLPSNLHKDIKKYCATRSVSMKEKITQILTDFFKNH